MRLHYLRAACHHQGKLAVMAACAFKAPKRSARPPPLCLTHNALQLDMPLKELLFSVLAAVCAVLYFPA